MTRGEMPTSGQGYTDAVRLEEPYAEIDEPELDETPDLEIDDPETDKDLFHVLERQFMKRTTNFRRPKKSEFEARLRRVLSRLDPSICIPTDLMDYLYRAGVNLPKVVKDWNDTMKAINSPTFAVTRRYLDDQILKAAKFYRALGEDRKSELPESVYAWHRGNVRDHIFMLKSGIDYLKELENLTKMGRTNVISRLLWYQHDLLKSRLKGTGFARKRFLVLAALMVSSLPETKGKNVLGALRMRLKRANDSEVWGKKSLATQLLLSLQLYAEIDSDEAGLAAGDCSAQGFQTALKPR